MTSTLTQKRGATTTEFELADDGRLTLKISDKKSKNAQSLHVKDLSEEYLQASSKGHYIDAQVVAGVLIVLLFATPGALLAAVDGLSVAVWIFFGLAAGIALLTVRAYRKLRLASAYDIQAYRYRGGGPEAFLLLQDVPDAESFTAFVTELNKKIIAFRPRSETPDESETAGLLDDLERLYARGALAESEFCAAKERVLAGAPLTPRMGFQMP